MRQKLKVDTQAPLETEEGCLVEACDPQIDLEAAFLRFLAPAALPVSGQRTS